MNKKIADSREVYLPARTKREVDEVNSLNDDHTRSVLKNRSKQLDERKEMDEWEFDDMQEIKQVAKLFTTCFIGNIAIFEEEFGSLWGHGKPWNQLTKSEQIWRGIWNDARRRVMDHSNDLMREAL
jgi:hypothetical protein